MCHNLPRQAPCPRILTRWAGTAKAIDTILADTTIDTRAALTFIYVHLAVGPCEACHTDAGELANSVKTCGLVAAGPRQTLVDIGLTARSRVATATLTQEGALCVHTPTQVFAGVGTNGALIHILVTCPSSEAGWTGADGPTTHRVGVTDSILMAGVANTCVVQMTQEACLAHRAGTVERGHTVMAGGPMEAYSRSTVINILTAALTRPAIDTDTAVATQ